MLRSINKQKNETERTLIWLPGKK